MDKVKEEGKIEVVKAMLANNVDVEIIAKFTSFSIGGTKALSENQWKVTFLYGGMRYREYNQCAVTKTRTWDLIITNDVLYHLSYNGRIHVYE